MAGTCGLERGTDHPGNGFGMRPQAAPALDATDTITNRIPHDQVMVFADEDKPRKLANLLQVHRQAITWSCMALLLALTNFS